MPEIQNESAFDMRAAFGENLKFIHKAHYDAGEIHALWHTQNQIVFQLGEVNFPTGAVVIADPLCYLHRPEYSNALNYQITPGSYPVLLSIFYSELVGLRILSAKLQISQADAVRYETAMPEGIGFEQYGQPGILAGFGVDAGLGCFCDKQTAAEFSDFIHQWHAQNLGKNHYDDYFAAFFAQSYQHYPKIQRSDGDFIMWEIPDSKNRIAMFASGFGDGFYQGLWGFDKKGALCELTIPFISPALFSPKQPY